MKKTAITQAIENIAEVREKMTSSSQILGLTQAMDILESYKKIEKEEIIKTGNSCALKQYLHHDRLEKMTDLELKEFAKKEHLTFGEQYYNEMFTSISE